VNITELEKLAKAAIPGPWIGAGPSFGGPRPVYIASVIVDREGDDDDCFDVCQAPTGERESSTDNLTYIAAANPQTILQLIELLKEMGEAISSALSDDRPYITKCEEALAKYKEVMK